MATRATVFALLVVFVPAVGTVSSQQANPAPPQALPPGPDYPVKWAVIIGVTNYPASSGIGKLRLDELRGAAEGALDLERTLALDFGYKVKKYGFDADHVKCLTNEQARQTEIEAALTDWLRDQKPQPEDSVLVYFAGHGSKAKVGNQTEGYLMAVDSSANGKPGVPMSFVRNQLAKLPCRHKLVILDCCYSGLLLRHKTGAANAATAVDPPAQAVKDPFAYYLSRPAFLGMSAGLDEEVLNQVYDGKYSPFTDALRTELRDRADTLRPDQAFTFGQLAARVKDRVTARLKGRQIPDYDKLAAEGDGDFVFRPRVRRLTPSGESVRRAYSLIMQSFPRAWEGGDVRLARQMLDDTMPRTGQEDIRGFEWHHWKRVANRERFSLDPFTVGIMDAVYSPDGKYFATLDAQARIRIWNAGTGELFKEYPPEKGAGFISLAYSPKGDLAVASGKFALDANKKPKMVCELWVIDPTTGAERLKRIPTGMARKISFSPDGRFLAAIYVELPLVPTQVAKVRVRVWDAQNAQEKFTKSIALWPLAMAFHPLDGRLAAVVKDAEARARIQFWDMTGKEIGSVGDFPRGVTAFAFHPVGDAIITATRQSDKLGIVGELAFWDLDNGTKPIDTSRGHSGSINSIAFDSLGERFVTAGEDRALIVWDTGRFRQQFAVRGHTHPISALSWRPRSQEILSATMGRSLPAPEAPSIPRPEFIKAMNWTDDPAEVKVWDVSAPPEGWILPGGSLSVTSIAFRPGGKELAAGYEPNNNMNNVAVWNIETGKQVALPKDDPELKGAGYYPGKGGQKLWNKELKKEVGFLKHDRAIGAIAYAPDGKTLAVGEGKFRGPGEPGGVRIWNADTGASIRHIPVDCGGVFGLAFQPDGKQMAAACWDTKTPVIPPKGELNPWPIDLGGFLTPARARGQVRAWRTDNGAETIRLLESAPVTAVGYAPGRYQLGWATWQLNVIPNAEVNVRGLLKVRGQGGGEGKLVGEHRSLIRGLAFSPDGTKIATAGADGAVKIWSLADGEKSMTLRGHLGGALAVAFSPDGQRLASGGWDKVVRVWDVLTGYEVLTLTGHGYPVTSVAFSSDGRSLAAGSFIGEIRVWQTAR